MQRGSPAYLDELPGGALTYATSVLLLVALSCARRTRLGTNKTVETLLMVEAFGPFLNTLYKNPRNGRGPDRGFDSVWLM